MLGIILRLQQRPARAVKVLCVKTCDQRDDDIFGTYLEFWSPCGVDFELYRVYKFAYLSLGSC